jgi:hypothetical protein
MGTGVLKDEKLKLRDLHASDTLGCMGLEETRLIDERFASVMREW